MPWQVQGQEEEEKVKLWPSLQLQLPPLRSQSITVSPLSQSQVTDVCYHSQRLVCFFPSLTSSLGFTNIITGSIQLVDLKQVGFNCNQTRSFFRKVSPALSLFFLPLLPPFYIGHSCFSRSKLTNDLLVSEKNRNIFRNTLDFTINQI